MKVPIQVCEVCRRPDCGGKIYSVHLYGSYGLDMGIKQVCESDPNLFKEKGKLFYRLVSGHGDTSVFEVSA